MDQLLFHGIEVGTPDPRHSRRRTYPAGSYVVDMHQPLRGLANVLLDLGADISAKVPSMYDISAWSLALPVGSQRDKVGSTTDAGDRCPPPSRSSFSSPTHSNADMPDDG